MLGYIPILGLNALHSTKQIRAPMVLKHERWFLPLSAKLSIAGKDTKMIDA
jgi:hypothetical protein